MRPFGGRMAKKPRKKKKPLRNETWMTKALGLFERVPRRDALERQLDTAICLWFSEKNALAIHLIAMASYHCLCDLKGKKVDLSEAAYDWLRHASTDLNDRIDFSREDNTKLLWEATMLCLSLFGSLTPRMRAFQLFFVIQLPKLPQWRTQWGDKDIAPFMPKGLAIGDVENLRRREFFRKLTKRFEEQSLQPTRSV